jgi:hypothetical protein
MILLTLHVFIGALIFMAIYEAEEKRHGDLHIGFMVALLGMAMIPVFNIVAYFVFTHNHDT